MRWSPLVLPAALVAATAALAQGAADPWARLPDWMVPPPVPEHAPVTPERVELGRRLFHDARLSLDGTVACASCHVQAMAFANGEGTAAGVHGDRGRMNVPSLANAAYMPALTWANPALTALEAHALVPLFGQDPVEMGMAGGEAAMLEALAADPVYEAAFASAFPERGGAVDLHGVTLALGAFQRTILSFEAPYDRYLRLGEEDAISEAAKRGEALFFDHGLECYHCHGGATFTENFASTYTRMTGAAFRNTGLYDLDGAGAQPPGGLGLAAATGEMADAGRFRTPSLRNVALTAPYMHDGSIATLEEVVAHYAAGGRTIASGPHAGTGHDSPLKDALVPGFEASPRDVADLVAFLESLSDPSLLTDPALSDPWPEGHPARADRRGATPAPDDGDLP